MILKDLPTDILFRIDGYYDPYKKLFRNVLFDIYNPFIEIFKLINKELSNKAPLSIRKSKNRYLKIKEYIGISGCVYIHIIDLIRPINGGYQLPSNVKILDTSNGEIVNKVSNNWVSYKLVQNTCNVYNDAIYL